MTDAYVPADREERDPPRPVGLPAGWELERKFDKQCNFYVPTSRALLPPPIKWEACPPIAKPNGVQCRLIAPSTAGAPGRPFVEGAWVTPDGKVVFGGGRSALPSIQGEYLLFAEADGDVHTAMFSPSASPCRLARANVFARRYSARIYQNKKSEGGGLFASNIDDLAPRVAVHLDDQAAHSVYAGPFAILDLKTGFRIEQYSWQDGSLLSQLWSAAQDNGLDQGPFAYANDALFWTAGNLNYQKIKVYTPANGVRAFLNAGMVIDHGHVDIGTDGKALVWMEVHGRKTGGTTPFDKYDIMTSPYATDPTKVAPRRLRSEQGPAIGVNSFTVGCGYAARTNGHHIRVVRLSDGRSWVLESPIGAPWRWSHPLALTCDELFAQVGFQGETDAHLVRARLDSLGPGIAAD